MVDTSVSGLDPHAAAVATQVTGYVRRNSRAADTCIGITRWWLPAGSQADPAVVLRALEALVRDGVLQARRLPSGECLYSAAGPDHDSGQRNEN
ncbi:hypothetical protein ACIP1U_16955 [Cupriavidus sp. NPDC089707]|uniref:hypothetical protein n=1 Tax=Cupriavidus sp. NPDC089707 TaxID=3363963 RepID=UPI0037FCE4FD